jgi:hypothetical protein
VFCEAEQNEWRGEDGNMWSVASSGEPAYGVDGERLAHFPAPVNENDSWHGFPFSRRGRNALKRRVPDDLLLDWRDKKRITFTDYNRILQGRM